MADHESAPEFPTLHANEIGVWVVSEPGRRYGIEWAEVYRVTGYKLDGITEIYTCVELDFEYGHFIELNADWPGFRDVIAAITERLPGIDPAWFQAVERLDRRDAAIECWIRE